MLGPKVIQVIRTIVLEPGGVRSVWYLPDGSAVHAIEDDPIAPGVYFLRPDDTGRFRNWVIEDELNTGRAGRNSNSRGHRWYVEVHLGNTLTDTDACVCPGLHVNQEGVADSRGALDHMREVLERDTEDPPTWVLNITGIPQ